MAADDETDVRVRAPDGGGPDADPMRMLHVLGWCGGAGARAELQLRGGCGGPGVRTGELLELADGDGECHAGVRTGGGQIRTLLRLTQRDGGEGEHAEGKDGEQHHHRETGDE